MNLIPYNPVDGLPYRTPASTATNRFAKILEQGGLNVAVRWRKGDRIDAACGQLRTATPDDARVGLARSSEARPTQIVP